ncbi:DUF5313 domain-containing protein [Mycobacterium sp. IDR2000157661]|uniref:DUF5313 domain-containing protein n=1 Tax=Mycobacterium sp. IDR2000157661 TaxID=2867005 RepID=UPI001EEE2E2D|nr:DUF5313 domain-containing protein [Mycobacterium sp. IDR2000157661]ULE35222.1 DUF5313 domain-containing protein [Mycobacterium sp. IDR2000157661]
MSAARPSLIQYIAYSYGRILPASMREWVANDLAGPGAVRRHMIRMAIPPLLVLGPFWLLPASFYVRLEMTAPIYIWALLMALALNKVWRRHRLAQHNLDPTLVDVIRRQKDAQMHEDYIRRFGPRPEDARRQQNSSPF